MEINQTTLEELSNEINDLDSEQGSKKPSKAAFDTSLITEYPKAKKKLTLQVREFNILKEYENQKPARSQSIHISPYGLEFQVPENYETGTLLKIDVSIPNYWNRKQQVVDYSRIDTPKTFKILAKVIEIEEIGKRGKKKLVRAQTLNIEESDEQVLRNYLDESK